MLRAQRGAQPTCNANTQRGALSSEPLVGISPLQEYDWEAVSKTASPASQPDRHMRLCLVEESRLSDVVNRTREIYTICERYHDTQSRFTIERSWIT